MCRERMSDDGSNDVGSIEVSHVASAAHHAERVLRGKQRKNPVDQLAWEEEVGVAEHQVHGDS
jgi:hypothetical protein